MHRLRRRPPRWSPAAIGGDRLIGWWDASHLLAKIPVLSQSSGAAVTPATVPDLSGWGRDLTPISGNLNVLAGLRGEPGFYTGAGVKNTSAGATLSNRARFYVGIVGQKPAALSTDVGYLFGIPRGSGSNGVDMGLRAENVVDSYLNPGGGLDQTTVSCPWSNGDVFLLELSVDFTVDQSADRALVGGDAFTMDAVSATTIGPLLDEVTFGNFGTGFSDPVSWLFHEMILVRDDSLRNRHGMLWRRYCRAKWGARTLAKSSIVGPG